jgi:hypothetical protein
MKNFILEIMKPIMKYGFRLGSHNPLIQRPEDFRNSFMRRKHLKEMREREISTQAHPFLHGWSKPFFLWIHPFSEVIQIMAKSSEGIGGRQCLESVAFHIICPAGIGESRMVPRSLEMIEGGDIEKASARLLKMAQGIRSRIEDGKTLMIQVKPNPKFRGKSKVKAKRKLAQEISAWTWRQGR